MRRTAFLIAALAAAAPAAAQEWQVQTDADTRAALAIWPSGHALVIRCQGEDLQTFIRLPAPITSEGRASLNLEGQPRSMAMSLPFGQREGAVLFAHEPARAARWIAGGGQLVVDVSDQETVPLALPANGEPVRETLSACDRALESARDNLPRMTNPRWSRRPDVREFMDEMDFADVETGTAIRVILSCRIRADGRVEDCEIEQETPRGSGVGRAFLRTVDTLRFEPPAPEDVGSVVIVPLGFLMD